MCIFIYVHQQAFSENMSVEGRDHQAAAEIAWALHRSIIHANHIDVLDQIVAFVDHGEKMIVGHGERQKYPERQSALGSADGLIGNLLLIFRLQTFHSKSCSKILEAILKLCHFSWNDRYGGHRENIWRLGAAGACQSVVKVLRLHVSDAISAVTTYKSALRGIRGKYDALDDNISNEILQYLYDRESNIEIARFGCEVIRILGWCNPSNSTSLICSGACEALVGAVSVHRHRSEVVAEGCEALWDLAEGKERVGAHLGAIGACEVVSEALSLHKDNSTIIPFVCGAINHLAINNMENKMKLSSAGVCEMLMHVLQSVHTDLNTVVMGCEAMKNLCVDNPYNADSLIEADVYPLLLKLLKEYVDDSGVVSIVSETVNVLIGGNKKCQAPILLHLDDIIEES